MSMNKKYVKIIVISLISTALTDVARTNVTQSVQPTGKLAIKHVRVVMIVRMAVNFAITKLAHVV